MARPISDVRVARSFVGNNGAGAVETVELDFSLGSREAIEIFSIQGFMNHAAMPVTAGPVVNWNQQTLHVEDDALIVPNQQAADADQFDNDSEVIFEQILSAVVVKDDVSGNAFLSSIITPNDAVVFAEPIRSPVNLTHRVENSGVATVGALLLIQYRYIELSDSELAFAFARRRR
jgi:hypothetical protein